VALAKGYGLQLARVDAAPLSAPAREALVELLLLAGSLDAAGRAAGTGRDARMRALFTVAGADEAPAAVEAETLAAALAGLTAEKRADDREERLAALLAGGRQGQAMLGALDLVAAGPDVDPPALRAAVLTLRLAGQTTSARRIALQTLLTGHR
jgi:hypothetical protein